MLCIFARITTCSMSCLSKYWLSVKNIYLNFQNKLIFLNTDEIWCYFEYMIYLETVHRVLSHIYMLTDQKYIEIIIFYIYLKKKVFVYNR